VNTDHLDFESSDSRMNTSALREDVRTFLRDELSLNAFEPRCNAWLEGFDPEFSRKLGERKWLGMTWPKIYGGGERSGLERFVVLEELLAAGAPVAAHWMAERQTGPALLRFGSDELRQRFLPEIARGTMHFSIGMSEPDAGSDLASVRTRAERTSGGWLLSGTKVWTSHASRSQFMMTLCRTSERSENHHEGLSQIIVDLASPGVEVRPINSMSGASHFAEVVLDSVFVSESMLLGTEGSGWEQVNAELAYERSGPERFLSTFPLFTAIELALQEHEDVYGRVRFGALVANLWTLRNMSKRIARQLEIGADPKIDATMVKDLGTMFENDVVDLAGQMVEGPLDVQEPGALLALYAQSVMASPGFTLRGGTTEILRNIIAKGLGQ
jgi:Acyl-CoA dehydrogenase, N-terminal domain/Acyl-CoA dehydrogenase, middle domain/Acyl-CoA dehydrogenase, C-terminal domain